MPLLSGTIMQSPPTSPFALAIQLLTSLHQEHHQALLEMQDHQEHHFRALVQAQQKDSELFRRLMDQEVRTGGPPTQNPVLPAHVPLNKMGPQNDPEAFIDL